MKVRLNTSKKDRAIRIFFALVFAGLNLSGITGFPESILVWIVTVIFISTAITGICPLYTLFGINTHTGKKAEMRH